MKNNPIKFESGSLAIEPCEIIKGHKGLNILVHDGTSKLGKHLFSYFRYPCLFCRVGGK